MRLYKIPSTNISLGEISAVRHRRACIGIAITCGFVGISTAALAANVIEQMGKKDPTTNGFSIVTCCGTGATGAGEKDKGRSVWAMGGGNTADQFAYVRALTAAQAKLVAKKGFVLTAVVRVLQGSGPAYSAASPVTIGDSFLDDGKVRWEIDVGTNANGDPVVVLPNTVGGSGPGGAVLSAGASYVLTNAGSSYNTYQLVVKSGAASLYVNGTQVLTGYTGETAFVSGSGLAFSINSGGQANYSQVGLTSTTMLP